MPEQTPPATGQLEHLLNDVVERLTYLEQIVVPTRVTKEELRIAVIDLRVRVMAQLGEMSGEIRTVQQQVATIDDLDRLREIVARARAELVDARSKKGDDPPVTTA
jgi:hypothetical protein